jgi:D-alanyl-lipoteichoic acid acyltransferase DltB (MBOAT superfamily)
MGYDLMINFNRPYFATSIGDFWHRWHISLSTWFRDYFYIPLGGSKVKVSRWYLNLFLTFLISGLWHGANWTFVIWGALHGIYIIIENYFKLGLKKRGTISFGNRLFRILVVFVLVTFAWIFFRADHVTDAFYVIHQLFDFGSFYVDYSTFFYGGLGLIFLFLFDFINEKYPAFGLLDDKINLKIVLIYLLLLITTLFIGVFNGGQFIYFQF